MAEEKDLWDKVSVVSSSLLVPVLIVAITFLGNNYINQTEQQARLEERDIETMLKFYGIYAGEKSFRLSRYFIPQIKSTATRKAVREYVIWDLLERNIHANEPFTFESELGDWHMLGEVIQDWCFEEENFTYFKEMRHYVQTERWQTHTDELDDLFSFIEKGYLKQHSRCH
jgi:hypothetical protein